MRNLLNLLVVCGICWPSISGHKILFFKTCPNITPMDPFDVERFLGKWYIIEVFAATDYVNKCMTMTFERISDTEFKVIQSREISFINKFNFHYKHQYSGTLTVTDSERPAEMKIKWPSHIVGSATFRVVDSDYDQYALINDCQNLFFISRLSFAILSRERTLDQNTVTMLRQKIRDMDIDVAPMSIVDQSTCEEGGNGTNGTGMGGGSGTGTGMGGGSDSGTGMGGGSGSGTEMGGGSDSGTGMGGGSDSGTGMGGGSDSGTGMGGGSDSGTRMGGGSDSGTGMGGNGGTGTGGDERTGTGGTGENGGTGTGGNEGMGTGGTGGTDGTGTGGNEGTGTGGTEGGGETDGTGTGGNEGTEGGGGTEGSSPEGGTTIVGNEETPTGGDGQTIIEEGIEANLLALLDDNEIKKIKDTYQLAEHLNWQVTKEDLHSKNHRELKTLKTSQANKKS